MMSVRMVPQRTAEFQLVVMVELRRTSTFLVPGRKLTFLGALADFNV